MNFIKQFSALMGLKTTLVVLSERRVNPDYLFLHLVGRSAGRHFSSVNLSPHLVGRSAVLICLPSSTPGRQVGNLHIQNLVV